MTRGGDPKEIKELEDTFVDDLLECGVDIEDSLRVSPVTSEWKDGVDEVAKSGKSLGDTPIQVG